MFAAAMLLFVAVNVIWAKTKFGVTSPTDFPYPTWTGTAIEDFLSNAKGRPQLALLGSSLVLTPLGAVDATYEQKRIDAPYHHYSHYFEDKFKEMTGQSISTFDFAIPGEMPSDAYFITKFLLKGEKRPDVVVYGVGPRDFMDNLLHNPASTDPYEHIARLGDISDHIKLIAPDWLDRLNFALAHSIFSYGHKTNLSCDFHRAIADILVPHLPEETPSEEWEYRQMIMPNFRESEVRPKVCEITPTTPETRHKFSDNIAEYKDRYRNLKWETFLTQFQFFGETLDLARERKIHVVVVSMPITKPNRDLISGLAWKLYKENLRVLAQIKGATFIDLEASHAFNLSDFGDTVHLNSAGGHKMLNILARSIANDNGSVTALKPKSLDETEILPTPAMLAGLRENRL